jgi:hypothetical protein
MQQTGLAITRIQLNFFHLFDVLISPFIKLAFKWFLAIPKKFSKETFSMKGSPSRALSVANRIHSWLQTTNLQ